jgi:adenylate kinase family enzyme
MKSSRIHLMGASGSGVTTLGRALAGRLALPHHDTDDYFWLPTVPPYRTTRPAADRLRLMREMFLPRRDWVLSGSVTGWGDELVPLFDLVVYVTTPRELRMQRLRAREAAHFGADAVAPGGWRHDETESFVEWASHYEAGDREGRSRAIHEAWLARLRCPVVRIDGSRPVAELVEQLCSDVAGLPG